MKSVLRTFMVSALCGVFGAAAHSAADSCAHERYFASGDMLDESPLARPAPEFVKRLQAAKNGNAVEQRNLGACYESGYLVSRCQEKALHWYRLASRNGDEVAQKWLAQRDALDRLARGPECTDYLCGASEGDDAPRVMTLRSGRNGHFFADLTINGVTVRDALIDTGASDVAISTVTAGLMGVSLEGTATRANTANGVVSGTTKVVPQVRVGQITLRDIQVTILPNLGTPLIGMSFLGRLKMNAANGQMILSR